MHTAYLSLGANIGDRRATMLRAIDMIAQRCGTVARQSSFIETEPWGFVSSNRFLNAAVMLLTELTPHQLLRLTQQIERELGRTTKTNDVKSEELRVNSEPHIYGYCDRPIDIDILTYDDLRIDTPDLTLPHPRMSQRDFVMIPLSEIMR